MKAFVDTNIFIDYYFNRGNSIIPFGEFTFQFFKNAVECKHFILICPQIIKELCKVLKFSEEDVWSNILQNLKNSNKIELIMPSEEQSKEALRLKDAKRVSLNDALFAILARDNNAVLVSRDWHHHENLGEIVKVSKPEDLQ